MADDGSGGSIKTSHGEQGFSVSAFPEAARVAAYVGRYGWTDVEFAGIPDEVLREIIEGARARTAPRARGLVAGVEMTVASAVTGTMTPPGRVDSATPSRGRQARVARRRPYGRRRVPRRRDECSHRPGGRRCRRRYPRDRAAVQRPLADGATLQRASQVALRAGASLDGSLRLIERIGAERPDVPLVPMGYANQVIGGEGEAVMRRHADAGAAGVIVADLTPDEGGTFETVARDSGMAVIYLVAPTTPPSGGRASRRGAADSTACRSSASPAPARRWRPRSRISSPMSGRDRRSPWPSGSVSARRSMSPPSRGQVQTASSSLPPSSTRSGTTGATSSVLETWPAPCGRPRLQAPALSCRRCGSPDHGSSREIDRFQADPSSLRNATVLTISVTIAVVIIGSVVISLSEGGTTRLRDRRLVHLADDTTVGYGDVTPDTTFGRFVAGVVTIVAIGFTTIVTALITSTFVEAAQRERRELRQIEQRQRDERTEAQLRDIAERLTSIEARLDGAGQSADRQR